MRIKPIVTSLAICCISSLSLNTAMNQSAIAQTAYQIRKMRSAGAPVVRPSYVPRGFRLTGFKMTIAMVKPPYYGNEYEAIYKGPNNCQFTVTGESNAKWGALGPIRQWAVKTPAFREKIILEEWDGSSYSKPNYFIASVGGTHDSRTELLLTVTGESHAQSGSSGPISQWAAKTPAFREKIILEEWDGSSYSKPNYFIASVGGTHDSRTELLPGLPGLGYMFNFDCKYSVFSYKQALQILKSVRSVK